ncbi:bifunctional pyr operon transcriptional regulator/uracil phosphoribosyltransferase PyrR [Pelistega sp. NLN82]|uniref:Bifunctional pyr operon transcriptional regulator/uracil phosphoribosyltransferase PyrR n=1 Tax=Pelistega ratti TaxID=2652177 RepID=A0A6L9Y4A4_9BURK|nr:bifunctional pyr operon transcriptional regulator/uracil phosphoribosyltransferase PyrR [Pelistega ratti]NEN75300.1 bifunctional pyr operon transcriptional regulator/uracil phosphoribosyltransferase PyrR [Pelistega ratti]
MQLPTAEQLYMQLKKGIEELIKTKPLHQVHLVGIYSGGAWIVQRLQKDLNLTNEVGYLNTSFYRDDFHKIGLHTQKQPTQILFDVNDKHIIVVDDILYTGRTIRATMNELFDYGRPASIALAVLIDRGGRQLPIEANVVGGYIPLAQGTNFVLSYNEQHLFDIAIEKEKSGV